MHHFNFLRIAISSLVKRSLIVLKIKSSSSRRAIISLSIFIRNSGFRRMLTLVVWAWISFSKANSIEAVSVL